MNDIRGPLSKPDAYWERAGKVSYAEAMFTSGEVEQHVNRRLWSVAVEIADQLGVPRTGHVLDLGCGDGAFASQVLAGCYRAVDGYDKAEAAIERAKASAGGPHMRFVAADLVAMDYGALPKYDGAFLMGFLHHVKAATPDIVRRLRSVTRRIVILEPNGNNLVRKLLEFTPTYRSAGEDSFRSNELMEIFAAAGFRKVAWRRMNLFPNFTPGPVYRLLSPLEPKIEASSFWNALCTVNMCGFAAKD
jgi:SAM-dependent methyltransferase